jgi:hypothetical protein
MLSRAEGKNISWPELDLRKKSSIPLRPVSKSCQVFSLLVFIPSKLKAAGTSIATAA